MTADEKAALQERMEKATDLERRIKYLEDAIKRLDSGIAYLLVPLSAGARLHYRKASDTPSGFSGFDRICWSDDEPDLGPEMAEALRASLVKRLQTAEAEYAAL